MVGSELLQFDWLNPGGYVPLSSDMLICMALAMSCGEEVVNQPPTAQLQNGIGSVASMAPQFPD
jgi:hypothetical protein